MGLEKVIEKIEKEGEQEIRRIDHEAEMQAHEILASAKQKADELSIKKTAEWKKHLEHLRIQERSIAELEAKKIRLNAEKDMLDATYQECLDALSTLPHKKILSVLLEKIKKELPEAVYIYSNKRDESIVRSLSTSLKYEGTIECIGGVVIENEDKTLRLDYRYESIASNVWNSYLKELASLLFK